MTRVLLALLLAGCVESPPVKLGDSGATTDTGCAGADCHSGCDPVAPEICNGLDDDCDGAIDEDVQGTFYGDADEDGFGDAETSYVGCEPPSGYVENDADCDDTSSAVYPAAPEVCDALDDDCDGEVDEGVTETWYADADGDGHGDPAAAFSACELPENASMLGDDCDDTSADVYPGNTEVCDELDNDCNGAVDDGVTTVYYQDVDGDGWGDEGLTQNACAVPSGYAEVAGDCDDLDPDARPDGVEVCDGVDDDCDGDIDEDATDAGTWYADADGDGYGDPAATEVTCDSPAGYVANADDCDDTNAAINPDTTWYYDYDGDGYGDLSHTLVTCAPPSGWVADTTDCVDSDAAVNPGAAEVCNGTDDDCDGLTDFDDPSNSGGATWYLDADSDGYGDPASSTEACDAPTGYVADASDCDDAEVAINPAAVEVCNGDDDDCDALVDDDDPGVTGTSTWYADADGDGYGDASSSVSACDAPGGYVADDTDCDDTDPSAYPTATETFDGVDEDCDGTADDGVYGLDCADILDVFPTTPNGTYTIDPDGSGGTAPFSVECEMTIDGGGWTQAIQGYLDHLSTADSRRYLYTEGGAWYMSPITTLVWDWTAYQPLNGDYSYASSGTVVMGTFACVHGESGDWGVGCSNGPGATYKVLPIYASTPSSALSTICQDQPDVFAAGACQADASIWSREE